MRDRASRRRSLFLPTQNGGSFWAQLKELPSSSVAPERVWRVSDHPAFAHPRGVVGGAVEHRRRLERLVLS
jgi:hypothetical protein